MKQGVVLLSNQSLQLSMSSVQILCTNQGVRPQFSLQWDLHPGLTLQEAERSKSNSVGYLCFIHAP